jgi:threonine dehydratase
LITLDQIKLAQKNLSKIIAKTPLALSSKLTQLTGKNIYLKKENLQNTGSFKLRGAFNKIASLSNDDRKKGVVAASAGNHAQGVAFSAKYFNIPSVIIMPEATPLLKVSGVKSFGSEVILYGNNYDEAYKYAVKYCKEHNSTFIHPFEDDEVIAGQGTIALEILEDLEDIDILIAPIGGGGLISGLASTIKQLKPSI